MNTLRPLTVSMESHAAGVCMYEIMLKRDCVDLVCERQLVEKIRSGDSKATSDLTMR